MLDVVWISLAFALGLIVRQVSLPPLVGYLIAGFVLSAFGVEADAVIDDLADLGVTLLLFTIGLKLKVKSLARPQVWAVALLHMAVVVALLVPTLLGLGALGVPLLAGLSPTSALLLAFALSFSSTVFAVKVLEEKGEMGALYATIAIGILIMQDLAAVLFLGASTGKVPSPWALLLLALIPLTPVLKALLERAGHGELLLLAGLMLGLGGAELFEVVHVKGDLGALIIGVLVASSPKASELAKSLLNLKDLFLVAFFLSIGLGGLPTLQMDLVAVLLLPFALVKGWLFQGLMLSFRLRARTAYLGGLALGNYSEFGLIVAAIGVANGWIATEWLTVIALALALSFVVAAPLNARSHLLYERRSEALRRREHRKRIPDEAEIDPGAANAMVIGMGRVGAGAYDALRSERGMEPVGVDADPDVVRAQLAAGRTVVQGSATDADFWHRLHLDDGHVRIVLLALPEVSENHFAATHLRKEGYSGPIGAIAKYPDDAVVLVGAGVDQVFNLYAEAGAGFAQHVCSNAGAAAATR
jgi:predicted Kef-type K+ transport protein